MESAKEAARLEFVREAGSTNDDLVRLATGPDSGEWPDFSVLVTDNQTAGRGRLGREWVGRPGASLAISVLVRPARAGGALPIERFGWFPLLAGLAMARAIDRMGVKGVGIKWPNDILIDGRKVCGILTELLPGSDGIVIGAGLNVSMTAEELPTQKATSLRIAGARDATADRVLAAYLRELRALFAAFAETGDEPLAEVRRVVSERCDTIGRPVRIELPSGAFLEGTASGLDETGRLIVQGKDGTSAVAAGDVTHLRY